jgi:hypothetical protein
LEVIENSIFRTEQYHKKGRATVISILKGKKNENYNENHNENYKNAATKNNSISPKANFSLKEYVNR